MIKPIYKSIFKYSFSAIKASLRESAEIEDDIEDVLLDAIEITPTCKDEQELREWIRTQIVKRKLEYLFVHCTATNSNATVSAIVNYWKRKGWKNPGYNVILPEEGFTVLADLNSITNGVKGYNSKSIHISYIGGKDGDTRTPSQARLIRVFIEECVKMFPDIKVLGHNEVSSKRCPSFKVKDAYPEFWTGL